jgi:hypothetical protein
MIKRLFSLLTLERHPIGLDNVPRRKQTNHTYGFTCMMFLLVAQALKSPVEVRIFGKSTEALDHVERPSTGTKKKKRKKERKKEKPPSIRKSIMFKINDGQRRRIPVKPKISSASSRRHDSRRPRMKRPRDSRSNAINNNQED